jgi:hypothetical protein
MSLFPSGPETGKSTPDTAESKPRYPGLGLPLRDELQNEYFPIGAHGGCYDAESSPLTVREVAMMNVMEALTDKIDWHQKVNDESIVSKWRSEARAIPNTHWLELATSAKRQHWEADGFVNLHPDSLYRVKVPDDIMSSETFDYVNRPQKDGFVMLILSSALKSFAPKPSMSKRRALCLLLMPVQRWPNLTIWCLTHYTERFSKLSPR